MRVMQDAYAHGAKKIITVTKEGEGFYERFGFVATGKTEKGTIMEVELERK